MSWFIIPVAFILDLILGDPVWLPHPIRWMGNAITYFEPRFRKIFPTLLVSGAFFAIFLILSTWLITFAIIKIACFINPILGIVIQVIAIYYCISVRSLERAAMDVFLSLKEKNIAQARHKLSFIVGRETAKLSEKKITNAVVETVAENFVDGVISPLFFAAIGGAPLSMAYKMVNTLDSMIGYKNDKYILFGKTAAKIDDVANFIPARISVLIIALAAQFIALKGKITFKNGIKQGHMHSSPNAGYPEASFSGALNIKLGGPNYYHGKLVVKPYIGKNFQDAKINKIRQACYLMIVSSFIFIGILIILGIFNTLR